MHVLDYIFEKLSKLFRFNNYPLSEKAYSAMFHVAGLNLTDLLAKYCSTMASRESVRKWLHKFSRIFSVNRRFRDVIAVSETVVKMYGLQ
jgi:hypothetical protein